MPDVEAAAPADAFAELMAEDNLVRVYHFNKHDQDNPDTGGWSLYDTRDAFMSLNSIDMIEPGEFYWLMMNNEQLNVDARFRARRPGRGLEPDPLVGTGA